MVTICTASLTFNYSTFRPHTVFMCFVWISEQTAIISLYNINWLVFVTQTQCVYCAVRTVSVIRFKFSPQPVNMSPSNFWPWTVFDKVDKPFCEIRGLSRRLVGTSAVLLTCAKLHGVTWTSAVLSTCAKPHGVTYQMTTIIVLTNMLTPELTLCSDASCNRTFCRSLFYPVLCNSHAHVTTAVWNQNQVRAKEYQERVKCRLCDYRVMWEIFCLGGIRSLGEKCVMRSFMIVTVEQIFG